MAYPGPPPPLPRVAPAHLASWEKGGELFPAHKTTLVQGVLDRREGMVGLEYVVEVRPVREGEPWYSCRLCDVQLRRVMSPNCSNALVTVTGLL